MTLHGVIRNKARFENGQLTVLYQALLSEDRLTQYPRYSLAPGWRGRGAVCAKLPFRMSFSSVGILKGDFFYNPAHLSNLVGVR